MKNKIDFYIELFTQNEDVQKRLDEYLDSKFSKSFYSYETNSYQVIAYDLTKDEVEELYDIFEMYDIDIMY